MESMAVPDQIWIIMITVVGAFVVTITAVFLMKQRIKGKEGAAGNTNTVSISSSTMESVRSQGSDRDSHTSITSEYDVFLSFRGPDARYGIVDHLYECMTGVGLRVFKDDEEIRRGEVIGGELERAIRSCRVYVVVFSRNYASSAWCLRELDMMVDLHGGLNVGKKIILPIFCKVDPQDVKLRTKLYRKALDKHKGRHGEEDVKKWEQALKTVGGISGWDSKAIQGEGRFVRLIVQDIIGKLRIKDQSLPEHLTGIDGQVSNMLNLLDYDSSGVRLVVLHGMGGIGKTTLARVIFNELHSRFEGSSFVSDVRETSKGHGGIEKLQNKLSEDILGGKNARSYNYDGEIIRRIQCKRILLVLDDVDAYSQLEKLLMKNPEDTLRTGSRVIITTRDKNVCNRFVRPGSELLHFYEMEKMADNYALQLFSRHAFGNDEPPEDYLSLSKQVVKTTGNLPLALEVTAGHLCCQSKELWEDMLKKLKNIPQKEVFNILKVSYDGLDCNEKEIFLDIACFQQHEMPQKYADYLWEARDLYPKCGVKVLINKSFIKIDSEGEFWIHDQLRDMGREIIRLEGNGRPERYTRLWDPKEALKIVLQKQVSKKIIAMTLGNVGEALKLSDENFGGLANLLFLDLTSTELIGEFENLWERLMWLSWRGCTQTLNSNIFKMTSLVVLRISGIQGEWTGGEKLMMPELKVLEFGNSDMTTSPDVSCCLKLEIMVFEYCPELKEIHHSVGKLERLAYLKILCVSLRILPESIGRLKSLRTLHLSNNKIRRLPASICDLTNLLVLDVANNPLDEGIPEEIGRLSALEKLDISYSNIRFLPATVSRLTSLKSLKLEDCKMLEELRGLPTSLTSLNASNCPLDKGIPDEIGSLSALVELNLMQSKIRFLPATVSQLTSLKSLGLQCCDMLRELPRLPTSLIYLTFSTKLLRAFPNLDFLTNLAELVVSDGEYPKKDYEGERLEISGLGSLGSLSKLETLILSSSYMESVLELPLSLRKLMLLDTRTPIPWEHYSNLTLLTELQISSSILTDMDLGGLDSLPRLMTLRFYRCYNLVRVSNIGRLRKGLRSLRFRECSALVKIQGLEQLEMLEDLRIRECPSICRILDLLGLKRLNCVQIWECSSLLPVRSLIDECHLSIFGCAKLRSFKGRYSEYKGESSKIQSEELLEELGFLECPSFCGIQDLRGVKRLKRVISWDFSSSLCVSRLIDECRLYIFLCHKNREFVGNYYYYY